MSDGTRLGPGAEFDAIRRIVERLGDAARGIGDDAALLDLPRGERIVASVDAAVEGRHFREGWLSPREIGRRATTAALSDIAAMAARPLAILWAVNLPERWRPSLDELATGVREAALAAGAAVAGGNIASAEDGALSLTTTVIGTAFDPLKRAGAKPGDRLYVTGRLGGPALALRALERGETPLPGQRERFAAPVARIHEARWLSGAGASAGLDISDGLAGDARHLAAASGVALEIDLEKLPLFPGADDATAASSGEEYELLVAAPSLDVPAFAERFGIPLTEIGRVASLRGAQGDGSGAGAVAFLRGGRPTEVGPAHDHFRR